MNRCSPIRRFKTYGWARKDSITGLAITKFFHTFRIGVDEKSDQVSREYQETDKKDGLYPYSPSWIDGFLFHVLLIFGGKIVVGLDLRFRMLESHGCTSIWNWYKVIKQAGKGPSWKEIETMALLLFLQLICTVFLLSICSFFLGFLRVSFS